MLEQEIDFINEDEGIFALCTVLCNAVEDGVQYHQHPDGHKLLAEVKDVVADESVVGIHIGVLGKGVQRAVGKQLDGKGDLLRLRLGLFEQLRPEVLQGGNLSLVVVLLIGAVDACRTAVDDGFLHCTKVVAADELLTQGHNELGFQDDGVCTVTVLPVHIHRIDVGGRGGGDVDDLAAHCLYKLRILPFGVDDDNICIAGEHLIDDLTLCGKGLAAARHAEDKLVAVEKLPAVGNDHILGNDILPVVNAVFVVDVLHPEWDKHRKALGGEGAEGVDLPSAEGHHRIQPVKLLELQHTELAKVLSCGGQQGFGVAVKLLLAVRRVYHRKDGEHHTLVTGGQVIEKLLHLLALLFKVIGNLCGEVVVGVLSALPVGHIGFHAQQTVLRFPDGFVGGDGNYINGQHQVAVEVGQLRHHSVLDIRRILTQEQHPAVAFPDLEIVLFKLHRVGADEVLEVVSLFAGFLHIKAKAGFLARTVEVMENAEAFVGFHLHALAAKPAEVGDQVCAHTGKIASCFLHILLVHGDGDILLLRIGVCARRSLKEHFVVFLPVLVEGVALEGHKDGLLKVQPVQTAVVDGDLGGRPAVKRIEQLGVFEEHRLLVLTAGDGIVDVGELEGSGELVPAHLKDAIIVNRFDGNDILYALGYDEAFLVLLEQDIQCFNHWLSIPPSS